MGAGGWRAPSARGVRGGALPVLRRAVRNPRRPDRRRARVRGRLPGLLSPDRVRDRTRCGRCTCGAAGAAPGLNIKGGEGTMGYARAAVAALIIAVAGCSGPPASAPPRAAPQAAPHDAWPEFAARFIEDYFKANPFFAVQSGRHEFDGQMADWSAAGIAAEVPRMQKLRSEAQAFDPAGLSAGERFERDYLLTVIDADLFWLDRARSPFTNPAWYIERLDPDVDL